MSMEVKDKQSVFQAIKNIADDLCKENKTYLRADLAYDLKKFGVDADSAEVSKLVYDAYKFFRQDGHIAIAFVSNNSRTTLVAEYKLNDCLEQGDKEEALKIAETELAQSSTALSKLSDDIELNLNMVLAKGASKLVDVLSVFQTSVKHDATRIKADMGRLLVIYKTLNDVVIPKANVFLRYGERLMSSDLKAIMDSMYDNAEIRPLEEQRRQLLQQLKAIDIEMNDHLQNIDVYSSLISDITSTLESKQASYMQAKSKQPSKPFFLVNWLTFGTANKNYYRDFSEWNANCFPLIREYESYQVDLKLDKDELASHNEAIAGLKSEHSQLSVRLDAVSKEIRSKIVSTDDVKLKMLKHLRDMVAMLKLGREIMESKLDERLIHTVEISDYKETAKLPADIEENLSQFTGILADNLYADRDMAIGILDGTTELLKKRKAIDGKANGAETKQNAPVQYSDEDLAMVTDKAEESVQRAVSLFDSLAKLKLQQLNGKLASAAYDKELAKYSDMWKRDIAKIDNKSAYLREVFKRINLASSEDERKQAMLLLSDISGYKLSEHDFADFMNGKKQIEL